jgi:hypothetical protein
MLYRTRDPLREATLKEVSGHNRVAITFDNTTVLKNVPVIGNASFLRAGQRVTVLCVDNHPVVFSDSGWGDLPAPIDGEIVLPVGSGITLHPPVTLDSVEILALFSILRQKLDLDTQVANTVLAGPASGADAKPTFRSLLLSQLGDVDFSTPPTQGQTQVYDATAGKWKPGAAAGGGGPRQWIHTYPGTLKVEANNLPIPNRTGSTMTISAFYADVGTAPTGAAIGVTLYLNGSSIATVEIAADATSGSSTGLSIEWPNGGRLTTAITSIGSTVAGANLVATAVAQ